jgi:uroporphyrinogen decarboxylase
MNSRERVIEAINHRQPDRVPLDLGSTVNSSIVVEGYERLKQHFGVQTPTTITNRMMRTVEVDEEILRALEVDFRGIICGAPFKGLAKELGDRQYRDQWGCDRIIQPDVPLENILAMYQHAREYVPSFA